MDQIEVYIVNSKVLQRTVNSLGDTMMPSILKLGGKEDVLSGNARVTNSLTDLRLVAVSESTIEHKKSAMPSTSRIMPDRHLRINVTIATLKGVFDGVTNLIWLGLPSSQADRRDLVARVEREGFPMRFYELSVR